MHVLWNFDVVGMTVGQKSTISHNACTMKLLPFRHDNRTKLLRIHELRTINVVKYSISKSAVTPNFLPYYMKGDHELGEMTLVQEWKALGPNITRCEVFLKYYMS